MTNPTEKLVVCPAYFEANSVAVFDFLNATIDSLPEWPELIEKISRARFARCSLSALPKGLTAYANIASLDLSENDFENVTAEEFYELRYLRQLDLSQNKILEINAVLPLSITYLDLSFNNGIDVECIWRMNLPKLEILKIGQCGFRTLPEREPTWMATVRNVALDGNELTELPAYFGSFAALEELSLFGNCLEIVDLPEFSRPLRVLNISMNSVAEVNRVAKVQTVVMNWSLVREVPTKLLEMEEIRAIGLSGSKNITSLDFALPDAIAVVDVSFCSVERVSENFTRSCGHIAVLNLAHNMVREIPDAFPEVLLFTQLNLSYNELSSLPAGMMNSRSLERLILRNNKLVSLPNFNFPQIRDFDVAFNQLENIPNCFESSSFLTNLNISFNKLTELPLTLTSARRLLEFQANGNLFTKIPRCLLSFASVKTVALSGNKLTSLPEAFGSFFFMKTLDLSNNHFKTVPSALSACMGLKSLSLSHNIIEALPDGFRFPANLCFLDLSFNKLTKFQHGPMPALMSLSLDCNHIEQFEMQNAENLVYLSFSLNHLTIPLKTLCQGMNLNSKLCRLEFFQNDGESDLDVACDIITDQTVSANAEFGVGYASSIGGRNYMEDFICIVSEPDTSCFAVFDGHAGTNAARIASSFFSTRVKETLHDPAVDLSEWFAAANAKLREQNVPDGCAGCCALIKGKRCYVAGIGDSRIVRIKSASHERMTTDHKPTDVDEFKRLKADGIGVSFEGRVRRKLAMSRALGDFWCKDLFVVPDVRVFDIEQDDVGLVIACDGLWDVLDDSHVAHIFRESTTGQDAASRLKNFALALGSLDNISVIAVKFHPADDERGFCDKNTIEELPVVVEEQCEEPVMMMRLPGRRRGRR